MNQSSSKPETRFTSSDIIGTKVTAQAFNVAVKAIINWAVESEHRFVCVSNVHMVVEAKKDASLAEALELADMVAADGMPLVWLMRLRGLKKIDRVAGHDLTISLCEAAAKEGLPVYFYGGTKVTSRALKDAVAKQIPTLSVVGCEAPPLLSKNPTLDFEVIERLRGSGAAIIFVGLGCPKQERWMAAYSKHIPATLIGVGAAFDFIAGTVPRAPDWMQRAGLEWLFRVFSEPKRLWRRYLISNSLFIWYLLTNGRRLGNKKN